MITKEMEEAFDTDNENFAKMMEVIGKRMFTKKKDGDELHHIIPVTWYAQTDEGRPDWMPISVFGKAIRSCPSHEANDSCNLVYLSHEEHQMVHHFMGLCANEDWEAPTKGSLCDERNAAGTYVIKRPSAGFDGVKFEFTEQRTFIVRAGERMNFTKNDMKKSSALRRATEGKVDWERKVFTEDVTFNSESCLFFSIAYCAHRDRLEVVNVDTNDAWKFNIIRKGNK